MSPRTPAPGPGNRHHVRRRALERYGVAPPDAVLDRIEAAIRSGSAEAAPDPEVIPVPGFRDPRRSLYAVRFAWRWLPVLWDEIGGCLITILPPHVLDRYCAPDPDPDPADALYDGCTRRNGGNP
jgi:hypothetical protein